jgi:hypothetical protein
MTNFLFIITAIHLAALSQIESGDNPKAVGKDGERTSYQISPEVARNEFKMSLAELCRLPKAELDGRMNEVWTARIAIFRRQNDRYPTLPELYLIWHRPARVLNPKPREKERAARFMNLVFEFQKEWCPR